MKVKKTDPTLFIDPYGEAKQKLLNKGYTEVKVDLVARPIWSVIHEWCKCTLQNHYTWFDFSFWFADPRDAVVFRLRWG